MLGTTFYHDLMKKYVAAFGTLFNDIKIQRENKDGTVIQEIEVPLTYSSRDKFITRLTQEGGDNTDMEAITLPRISFNLNNISYDPNRALTQMNLLTGQDRPEKVNTVYQGVPWDLNFQVNIYAESNYDVTRITESILPFFIPQLTPTIKLLDDPVITRDIPIVCNGVNILDEHQGPFEQREVLVHTIDFTMRALFFGPVVEKPLILVANTNFHIDGFTSEIGTQETIFETVSITPGQLANGSPTVEGDVSVAANTIYPNSEYGYVVDYSYGNDYFTDDISGNLSDLVTTSSTDGSWTLTSNGWSLSLGSDGQIRPGVEFGESPLTANAEYRLAVTVDSITGADEIRLENLSLGVFFANVGDNEYYFTAAGNNVPNFLLNSTVANTDQGFVISELVINRDSYI